MISEMKKAKSDMTPLAAAQGLIEKGGYANLMRGLPVRMAFYPLVVSLQFLVYDAVRIYLGVGADDLKQYLDVLGGALKKGGSMIRSPKVARRKRFAQRGGAKATT